MKHLLILKSHFFPQTELLLNLGGDPFILHSKSGKSALHFAAIVRKLLFFWFFFEKFFHKTLLTQGGYVDVAQFLLNWGCPIDVQSHSNGNTPLMDAAFFRNPRFFEFLLSRGSNVNSKSKFGTLVESYNENISISTYDLNSYTTIDILIKGARAALASFNNDPNKFRLFKAVAAGNIESVREILKNKNYNDINEKWPIDSTGNEGYSSLLLACKDGSFFFFCLFIKFLFVLKKIC